MSKGLNNGFCNLLSQRPNFLLRVSSDRQCLRCPIARILCRLTVRFGADREAAWASEGLRAAFADLMTKKPTWECGKNQRDARAMQKNCSVCRKNERASGTTAVPLAERSTVKVRQTQVRRSSAKWTRAGRRHDEPLGAIAATSLAAVWHASLQVQREDEVCKVRRRCFSARMQWPGMAFRSWW